MGRIAAAKPLPDDLTPHTGDGMPVDGSEMVEVMTAIGLRTGSRVTKRAGKLDAMAESPWIWQRSRPAGFEIVGFKIVEE